MSWFIKCLKQYADFSSRARRKEYWYFVLFASIINLVAYGLDLLFKTTITAPGINGGWFSIIVGVLLIVPSLAVTVRRLHDVNKNGFLLTLLYIIAILYAFSAYVSLKPYLASNQVTDLIFFLIMSFIYFAFDIWMIILLIQDSFSGVNMWGSNPKGIGNDIYELGEMDTPCCVEKSEEVEADKFEEVETNTEEDYSVNDETEEKTKKEDDNNII